MIGSSMNWDFIRHNYLFMLTGKGRGCFNIFVGTLLFISNPKAGVPSIIMGILMCMAGCFLLFLSISNKMSDNTIRISQSFDATKVMTNAATSVLGNKKNQQFAKNIAYENRDVIA